MWPFGNKKQTGNQVELQVTGMHCVSCGLNIDGSLEELPGVKKAHTDYSKGKTQVEYDPSQVDEAAFVKEIEKLGYQAKTSR